MKKKSLFGILILSACGIIFLLGLKFSIDRIVIRYWGKKVTVSVVELPFRCSKNSHLKVLYEGKLSEVKISKESCRNREYKVGQQITLFKHSAYDDFVWPGSHPELLLIIFTGILVYLYFDTRKKIKAVAHLKPHKRKPKAQTRTTLP